MGRSQGGRRGGRGRQFRCVSRRGLCQRGDTSRTQITQITARCSPIESGHFHSSLVWQDPSVCCGHIREFRETEKHARLLRSSRRVARDRDPYRCPPISTDYNDFHREILVFWRSSPALRTVVVVQKETAGASLGMRSKSAPRSSVEIVVIGGNRWTAVSIPARRGAHHREQPPPPASTS